MERKPINTRNALREINALAKRVNHGLPRGKWRLKEHHIQTFMCLLRRYRRHIGTVGELYPANEWPPMRISNPEMGQLRNVTSRTFYNHRLVLEDCKLIRKTKDRGQHHPYELEINPKFLGLVQTFDSLIAENFSGIIQDDLGSTTNTIKRGVDMLTKAGAQARQGNGLLREAIEDPVLDHPKQGGVKIVPQGPVREAGGAKNTPEKPKKPVSQRVTMLSTELVGEAWKRLWPEYAFNREQLDLTYAQVHRIYERLPERELDHWQEVFINMIGLAEKYVYHPPPNKAHHVRYIPLPWKWFNPDFKKGFVGVYRWYVSQETKRADWRATNCLSRQQERYLRNQRLPDGYTTKTRYKKTPAKMYRECLHKLTKHNRPDLIQRFNLFVYNNTKLAEMPTLIKIKTE